MLGLFAVFGATVSLLVGVGARSIQLAPDTRHGEDIGRIFGLAAALPAICLAAALPAICLAACLGAGAGIGYAAVARRYRATVAVVAVTLTLAGVVLVAEAVGASL